MRKSTIMIWGLLLLLFSTVAILLLALFAQPFTQARALVDPLARDGSLDAFSLALYTPLRAPMLALAGGLLLLVILRRRVLVWIVAGQALPGRFWRDLQVLATDIRRTRLTRGEAAVLGLVILLSVAARVPFLMRHYNHDEAYTVVTFAIQPLSALVGDYSMPNNHIFHTVLVRITYLLWGISPWANRLPALIAGLLCIPAVFFLARRLYNAQAALVAAAAAAAMPVMVNYATAARGYSLVMLFSLLAFLLADDLRRRPNLAALVGLIACATLGMWTIPIFMAPLGAVMFWLFLSGLVGDIGAGYTRLRFLARLVVGGASMIVLTLLLYLPVILRSGLASLISHDVQELQSWAAFNEAMPSRMQGHFIEVLSGLPLFTGWLIGIGFFLALVFAAFPGLSPGYPAIKVPHPLGVLGWTVGLYTLLRVAPLPRLVVFLAPYWVIWAAAGWNGLLALVSRWLRWVNLSAIFTGLVILAALLGTGWRVSHNRQANYSYTGDIEKAALFLADHLSAQDLVIVNNPNDAMLWYYTRLYGINQDHFKRELAFFRAYVLVDALFNETVETEIEENGPEMFFFDFNTARVVFQSGSLTLVEIIPFADLIRSEYRVP